MQSGIKQGMNTAANTPRILRHVSDGLCTLTLNRPDKLNALDNQTFAELDALLADIEGQTDRIGCIVLRGAGRGFCAGADLNAIGSTSDTPAPDKRWKPRIVERLASLPQPLVVAVHGVCFTGGLELALAADFIVAESGARFADTHGKWGLIGEWGMIQRLPRRIGVPAAKRMMFTARIVEAQEASTLGLVDMVAPVGALDAAVTELANAILANSWHTNIATKRLLRETDGMTLSAALAHEHLRTPGFAPDWQDRIARFSRKQPPAQA
jgi:enoyl-CoA hydratase